MSQPEETQWKNKWLDKGLPETLLDEMIDEVNAEYDTELGVWYFHRYAQVRVNVLGEELTTNEFYLYIIERAEQVFYGKGTLEDTQVFAQVPCTEIVFQVFKLHVGEVISVKAYGYTIQTIKADDIVTVFLYPVNIEPVSIPPFSYALFEIIDRYVVTSEKVCIAESAIKDETFNKTETVNIINV